MRVAVDATAIPEQLGGVGRYVVEVMPALAALGVHVTALVRPGTADWLVGPGVDAVEAPALTHRRPTRLFWEQAGLPALVLRLGVDVLWSPHYTMPAVRPGAAARVVTLHDATFFSSPEVHTSVKGALFRRATLRAVREADALVVPSAATRDEVLRYAPGDAGRFHVAHHGVDRGHFHAVADEEKERVAASLGLTCPYVAFVGTLEPRKNVPALVAGWRAAVRDLPDPPALVLAGQRGWDDEVGAALAQVEPHLTVVTPGYLPLADLPGFLAGAQVVAYPSLGEGFGLPVLEAMACGAVVLTTRRLSLPEVGGDAVAYCGTSPDEIAAGLSGLLADHGRRTDLAARATDRAALFTWDRSAREHLTAFEAALGRYRS